MSELSRMYQDAKTEYQALCDREKEIISKKSVKEGIIKYLEEQIGRKSSLEKVDRGPINDPEITHPVKRNKEVFMIRICSSFGEEKFSQQDVVNKLKAEYQTFDMSSVPFYLHALRLKKILAYDGLQYQVTKAKKKKYRDYGINVSQEVKNIVLNELGNDSLAFQVSRVFQAMVSKYPEVSVEKKTISSLLCQLEDAGKLTSQPGTHSRAAKLYSVIR